MNLNSSLYINKCKEYINFMFLQQQWSGLTQAEVNLWLQNFRTLTHEEMELVYKLLVNIIYFSEKDLESVLREGVYSCVGYKAIVEKQKNSQFETSTRALTTTYKDELSRTCFIPLLDSNAPHESGNFVARLLVQRGIIEASQSMFIEEAVSAIKSGVFSRIIIVDDCVGSGQQLEDFWNRQKILDDGAMMPIADFCKQYGVIANYLTLFGYEKNIGRLQKNLSGLEVHCVRMLRDEHRVFGVNSYIWDGEDELQKAVELFSSLCETAGIPLRGYRDLDFAFFMHNTIPDWSLPLFWKENADWNLLMRRKNSDE